MSLFRPDRTFLSYRQVTPALLQDMGVRVLLLDIDNTLAPYEQPEPDEHIRAWLQSLVQAGIQPAFLSNNHADRVELFNQTLALPVKFDAHKPLPGNAKKMIKRLGGDKKSTVLMGDQIFTDVCCAHMTGIRAFLVPPIVDRTDAGTRFKRWMERKILKRYYKKHTNEPDIRQGSPLTKEYKKI